MVLVFPLGVCLLQAILLASSVVQVSTSQPEEVPLTVTQSGSYAIKFQTSQLTRFFKCLCYSSTRSCDVFVNDDNFVYNIVTTRASYRTSHSQFVKFECKTFPHRNDFRCSRRDLSPFQCEPHEMCWKLDSYHSICNHPGSIGIFWNQNMSFSHDDSALSVRNCVSGCHNQVTTAPQFTTSVTSRVVVSDTGTPMSRMYKPELGWDNKTATLEILESKEQKSAPGSESGTNLVVYLVVGVLFFFSLTVTIVLGVIFRKRKRRQNHCSYQDPKLSLSVNMTFRSRCQQRVEERKRESANMDFNLNSAKTGLGEMYGNNAFRDGGSAFDSLQNGKNGNYFLNVSESNIGQSGTLQSYTGQSGTLQSYTGQSDTVKSHTDQSEKGKSDTGQSYTVQPWNSVELKTFCVSSVFKDNDNPDLNFANDSRGKVCSCRSDGSSFHLGDPNPSSGQKNKYNCQSLAIVTQTMNRASQNGNNKKAAMYATVKKFNSENKKIFPEKIQKVSNSKDDLMYPIDSVQKEPACCQTKLSNQKTRSSELPCIEKNEAKLLQDKNNTLKNQPIADQPHMISYQSTNEIKPNMAEERIYFELEKEEDIESDGSYSYSDSDVGVDFDIAKAFFDVDYCDGNPYENESFREEVVEPIYSQIA